MTAALPALRSGGLSITPAGRAGVFADTLQHADAAESKLAAGTATLTAEQLIRGYVVDVWDGRKDRWRTLCAAATAPTPSRANLVDRTVHDEGFVQLAVTAHRGAAGGPPILRLHESVARWDGWSLVAPRPGKAMSHAADPAAPPELPANDPLTSAVIAVNWKAEPGTLPTLASATAIGCGPGRWTSPATQSRSTRPPRTRHSRWVSELRLPPLRAGARADLRAAQRARRGRQRGRGERSDGGADRKLRRVPRHDRGRRGRRTFVPPRASVGLAESHGFLDDAAGRPRADLYGELRNHDSTAHRGSRGQGRHRRGRTRSSSRTSPTRSRRHRAARPAGSVAGTATLLPFTFKDEWPAAVGLRIAVEDGTARRSGTRPAGCSSCNWRRRTWRSSRSVAGSAEDDVELMAVWNWLPRMGRRAARRPIRG